MTWTPARLHYHVITDDLTEIITSPSPAAARRARYAVQSKGRTAHVIECTTSDPSCPHYRQPAEEEEEPCPT